MSKLFRVISVIVIIGAVLVLSNRAVQAGWAPREKMQTDAQLPKQEVQAAEPSDTQLQTMGKEGTIRPPACDGLTIVQSGQYSLCGVAVINAELKEDGIEVVVTLQPLPANAGKVVAGTVNLECWVGGKIHEGPHDEHAEPRICFAAPPGKDVEVRFFDETAKSWVAVETTVADGQACAPAYISGKYILVEK